MEFGDDKKRGDSVGLQNYLMYQRLKGEDVSIMETQQSRLAVNDRTFSLDEQANPMLESVSKSEQDQKLKQRRQTDFNEAKKKKSQLLLSGKNSPKK